MLKMATNIVKRKNQQRKTLNILKVIIYRVFTKLKSLNIFISFNLISLCYGYLVHTVSVDRQKSK